MTQIDLKEYFKNLKVSVFKVPKGEKIGYISTAPYHPSDNYPEYVFGSGHISEEDNQAYRGVRESLRLLGLDRANFGKNSWNPLGEIIKPGDNVVIKPNFVLSSHMAGGELYSIITHPAMIRAMVDYCYIAMRGAGKLTIADAPQMDCDFDQLLKVTRIEEIKKFYEKEKGFSVNIYDLRNFWAQKGKEKITFSNLRTELSGDPNGSSIINLGEKSEFYKSGNQDKFYGADFDRKETIRHHQGAIQEYSVSKTILLADVVISMPKLKVHRKTGVTLNAKGLVGINTNKNYLVHYTLGTPSENGDQFPEILGTGERFLVKTQRLAFDRLLARKSKAADFCYRVLTKAYKIFIEPLGIAVDPRKKLLDGGDWYGNDSAWKMVVDLMKIIYYADHNGIIQKYPQRKIFSVIDGIIGGEGEGPLVPDEKRSGVVIAGFNPVAVDLAAMKLMGFDWKKIRIYPNLLASRNFDFFINESGQRPVISDFGAESQNFDFKPSLGWKGSIELNPPK